MGVLLFFLHIKTIPLRQISVFFSFFWVLNDSYQGEREKSVFEKEGIHRNRGSRNLNPNVLFSIALFCNLLIEPPL